MSLLTILLHIRMPPIRRTGKDYPISFMKLRRWTTRYQRRRGRCGRGTSESDGGPDRRTFRKIDILVNNAGTIAGKDRVPVVDLAEEDWDRVQRVNVKGVFLCSQAVARHLIKQGTGGKIINMSSVYWEKGGSARFAAYSASKFAVIGFTQSLACELAPYQINVNAICPGLVDTERFGHLASVLMPQNLSADEQLSEYARRSEDSRTHRATRRGSRCSQDGCVPRLRRSRLSIRGFHHRLRWFSDGLKINAKCVDR